jgi:molybdopterin synthase sulfur carrier subunit
MTVNVLAFGITREIVGGAKISLELADRATIGELKTVLEEKYPALRELTSLLIAQDADFAGTEDEVRAGSELALIPPVSGG